ncbi:porin family protein [Alsobacter sp. SYSU M60028]|uniref:Porin family protein n=1 Tax=Alsobacter ponti TaxID=2962936 RepID=A0ABT1LHD0_9HYPH|nr:outer membrane protein [Alsobacter ponti]MCP8940100.1 porin family protein [Alsobacter ponti]
MRRVLLASVLSLAALPAFAADLPARTAPGAPAPAMASMYNWTGFYIGANAGYAWGAGDVNVVGDAAILANLAAATGPTSGSLNPGGFTAGAQAGFNYQINQFVMGVEADANWVDANDKSSWTGAAPGSSASFSSKVEWLSTVRARLGFAVNNVLVYGTGGVAFGQARSAWSYNDGTNAWTGGESGTRAGWALGAGVEYAFNRNWTAKVEYLHYDLGDKTFFSTTAATHTAKLKTDYSGNIVRAGINYKF